MSSENNFNRVFAHRATICYLVVIMLFLSCVLRIAVTATSDYYEVQAKQSTLRLKAGNLRGTIFDCNMVPITNAESKLYAAVSPSQKALNGIKSELTDFEFENLKARLKSGKPVLCKVEAEKKCDGIAYAEVFIHNSINTPAINLIGYTNSENHGVSGLEAAFDDLLYSEDDVSFLYTSGGTGELLEGIAPEINTADFAKKNGIITTLDINIQSIVDKIANKIETGAILVCESKTGKLKAVSSRPTYDCTNISAYLDLPDSPLMNRALLAYNVGSVFKPCVAAAGIEQNISDYNYTCLGSCKIEDRNFACHNRSGHGRVNLTEAIAYSCNTFFYNFGILAGGENIYKKASSLGLGKKIDIGGIYTASGNLPDIKTLWNDAYTANLSIGQGELLLSPVSMLNLYNSIACGGEYYNPCVIQSTLKNGSIAPYKKESPTRVMSEDTAALIKDGLSKVFSYGTAKDYAPQLVSAAGKTATAQTGKLNEKGEEICAGWFCGFFPADNPVYTVVVFSEDNTRQSEPCAVIFSEIADEIYQSKIGF
ncbi:MAG: penicillin-binding protein 2 [Clostridia bacterium]|nr:penicillin-binding protein 2 [Clostridia bacterium]